MLTSTEKTVVLACVFTLVLLFVNAYHREKRVCEKHFPDEVHECLWTSKYRVTADG